MNKIALDQDGYITQPSLHDFQVEQVILDLLNDQFQLKLRGENGQQVELQLKNVVWTNVSDIEKQNVILDILVLDCENRIEEIRSILQETFVNTEIERILQRTQNMVLLILSASVGTNMLILCRDIYYKYVMNK